METLIVNALVGFFLVLFAAMAAFPFLIEGKAGRATPVAYEDDVIISIHPAPLSAAAPRQLNPVPVATPAPDRREAA